MAEIAALGLACNILQMVEYGRQFATTAWKIYQSGEDALEGFSSLQMLSTNLENVARELEKETIRGSTFRSSQGIAKLCQESIKTAKEMLETLAKIGLLRNSKARKHEALSSAFMTWWNEDKIRALQQRLDSLGNQVTLFLLLNLRLACKISELLRLEQHKTDNQQIRSRSIDGETGITHAAGAAGQPGAEISSRRHVLAWRGYEHCLRLHPMDYANDGRQRIQRLGRGAPRRKCQKADSQ